MYLRWLPKVKDGIIFGMEHPDIVELEEERWALQESGLKVGVCRVTLLPASFPIMTKSAVQRKHAAGTPCGPIHSSRHAVHTCVRRIVV